jgi:hypothetical protein
MNTVRARGGEALRQLIAGRERPLWSKWIAYWKREGVGELHADLPLIRCLRRLRTVNRLTSSFTKLTYGHLDSSIRLHSSARRLSGVNYFDRVAPTIMAA